MTAPPTVRPLRLQTTLLPIRWLMVAICLACSAAATHADPPVEAPASPLAPEGPLAPDGPPRAPSDAATDHPAPAPDEAGEAKPASPFLIGTFALAPDAVVDGDTVRVVGRKKSVRVLGIDTEETFKRAHHRKAAAVNFDAYAKELRGKSLRPVKYGTPAGEAARSFLIELMTGVTHVRLERDRAKGRDVDAFGRTLAYVIALRPEGEINISDALIRAGHSPYFVKYGRSARFHKLFSTAESEAKQATRGIWGTTGPAHYPDYDERLPWWHARDKQMQAWHLIATRPHHITLGTDLAVEQLKTLVGKQVTVFGSVERLIESETSDRKIMYLSHRRKNSLPLVVFDKTVVEQLDMPAVTSMFVKATGTLSLYRKRPQIVITDPTQVVAK